MSDGDPSKTLERIPSGVPGLDAILRGGFFRGGVYLVLAPPGSGKTILGNQICFRHVAAGGRALFVTLLTESHARLITTLQTLAFFDPACVGASLSYVTGYQPLQKDKLKGLITFLRQVVLDHKATFLVIDGVVTAGAMAESELDTKEFINELQVFVELVGCTTLLLTGPSKVDEQYALSTMVDGLLEMHRDSLGMESIRTIEVTKFRGSGVLMGRHLFEITEAGVSIYPRTESPRGHARKRPDPTLAPRAAFGIKGLDTMLGGGLRSGSITMVLGTPGSGKTVLGLSLLAAGAREGEPGLYFGFFETPQDLCRKAEAIGLGLTAPVKSGLLGLVWQSPLDAIADELTERLLTTVREQGIRRLFVDGLGGFKDSLAYAERSSRFFNALCNELRSLGVVTLLSDEARSLGELEVPEHGLTAMLDNVVSLRHVERRAQLHKLVSVSKMRDDDGDRALHEFSIGSHGFVVSSAFTSAEAALGGLTSHVRGTARKTAPSSAKKGRKERRR